MDFISINLLVSYLMHFFGMLYPILEKMMGVSFDDLTTTRAEEETELG